MLIVGPEYINERSLPYASDILYHKHLVYFLPTGIHPIEHYAVAEFPDYCYRNSVELPNIIWEMCAKYFENTRAAVECLKILEPLRSQFITVVATSYDRNRAAINDANRLLAQHPALLERFRLVDSDLRFLARELLSHCLFEIFMEVGFEGALEYLRANVHKPEAFLRLLAAVVINRLKLFADKSTKLQLYEHSWYPLLQQYALVANPNESASESGSAEEWSVEHFTFKLFESILLPIYGRCDSEAATIRVAEVATTQAAQIDSLKTECRAIATEVILQGTDSSTLKQELLSNLIQTRLIEPIGALLHKPRREITTLLQQFLLDSTVIGGALALAQGASLTVVGAAGGAGALSAGMRYLLSRKSQRKVEPSQLLVKGINTSKVRYEEFRTYLSEISMHELVIPADWQKLEDKI